MATAQHAARFDGLIYSTRPTATRMVSRLMSEKLGKKRAFDHESQRVLRQCRRNTVDRLTDRIDELESLDAHRIVFQALTERESAMSSAEELRHKLAAIAGIVNQETSHPADIGDKHPRDDLLAYEE